MGHKRRAALAASILLMAGLSQLGIRPQTALAASQLATSTSVGGYHSCALESGKAYCWGRNDHGQLGDGSTENSSIPVAVDASGVLAGKTLTHISAGRLDTCALDSTGAAYCWGDGAWGNLGDGNMTDSDVPVAVNTSGALAGKVLIQIAAGDEHTCALDSIGVAYCWGDGSSGELGDGDTGSSDVPVAVSMSGVLAGHTLADIGSGGGFSCAVDNTDDAYCWGDNPLGELGDGATVSSALPVAVDTSGVLAGKALTQITVGEYHACVLSSTGAAYCWGANLYGELGNAENSDSDVPVTVDISGVLAGKTLTQITAGLVHTCALDAAGAAYCWGYNGYGELGGSSGISSNVPVTVDTSGVLADKTLAEISAGGDSACAVDTAGAAYCWGDNDFGELGDDDSVSVDSTVPVLTGPQAPSSVVALPGDGAAVVSWTVPSWLDGGSVTGYTATAVPGGQTCTTSAATCSIADLINGTSYTVTVVAHTTVGDSGASAAASVTPGSGVAITSAASFTATYGVPFSFTVTTSGSPPPQITKTGKLPRGVKFSRHSDGTATISGTPSGKAAGIYQVALTAKSKSGTATQEFTLTVNRTPAWTEIPDIRVKIGTAVHQVIVAAGFAVPALAVSGSLPAGLTFIDNMDGSGIITGTPAVGSSGRYSIVVTATNDLGIASHTMIIKVS